MFRILILENNPAFCQQVTEFLSKNSAAWSIEECNEGKTSDTSKRLAIKNGRSILFIKPEELDWADAEGKHVRLHIGKEMLSLKMSISALEQELDPEQFVRIHRSTIVNIDRVRLIEPWNQRRTYQVTLEDGTRLVLSRKNTLRAVSGKAIGERLHRKTSTVHFAG